MKFFEVHVYLSACQPFVPICLSFCQPFGRVSSPNLGYTSNSLAPEIIKAATKAQSEHKTLKYGACNSRVYDDLAEKFEILSYPWVAAFYQGKKVEDMAGMGGWESFYNWGIEKNKQHWKSENKPVLDAEIPEKVKQDGGKDEL